MRQKSSKNLLDPIPPSVLIMSKEEFKQKLFDRIEFGKKISQTDIPSEIVLEKIQSDFNLWNNYNSELLKQSFNNEDNEYRHAYDNCAKWVGVAAFAFSRNYGFTEKVKYFKEEINAKIGNLVQLHEKADLLKSSDVIKPSIASINLNQPTDLSSINNNVFIVHGHNASVKESIARTLEKLGLQPIILHEQPNEGKTIIEKFETHSNVGFAIVLLTDDDEGRAKTQTELKPRARQNVILELGYFIGKLGRQRVVPLYSKGVELPSDLYGLVYIPIDESETWKLALVKELKAAGYNIDANKIL